MSKFKNILDAANQSQNPDKKVKERTTDANISSPATVPAKANKKSSPPTAESSSQPIKKGRPKGKRSNPDFEQITAYVRSQTYRQTKIALLQQEEIEDFSELVEELLTKWLSTQKGKSSNT